MTEAPEIKVGSRVVWTEKAKAHYYQRARRRDGAGLVEEIKYDDERPVAIVRFGGERETAYLDDLTPSPNGQSASADST